MLIRSNEILEYLRMINKIAKFAISDLVDKFSLAPIVIGSYVTILLISAMKSCSSTNGLIGQMFLKKKERYPSRTSFLGRIPLILETVSPSSSLFCENGKMFIFLEIALSLKTFSAN
ncbi:hypothetical protein WICPIJ_007282 [Wickerhamomyces pijperi]|uniref:Uncharacterized protein n=1 Tax=Wickerhamomyces pijperi TaxID=599730 RepID=A0A9P8Q2X4_WICPI|nr:hypothetical protein WICPIJ_007282 [Wickerhamomyces pijperi]